MKKYLKLQAKKSLSLFLAVLMLLTCWVWVAPEKAEAANKDNGEYKLRMIVDITDNGKCDSMSVTVYYKDASGNQQSKAMTCNTTAMSTTASPQEVATLDTIPGFPIGFDLAFKIDGCNGAKEGTYNNFRLQVWNNNNSSWVNLNNPDCGLKWTDADGDKSIAYPDSKVTTLTENYPVAQKIGTDTLETKTLSIPKIGTTTTPSSVSFSVPAIYDQYGVKLVNETPSGYSVAGDQNGNEKYNQNDHCVWADGTTVKATPDVQKKLSATTGSKKVYLLATHGEMTAAVGEVTLSYPEYTVAFNQHGSISGLGASMDMSDNTTQTSVYEEKAYYSESLSKWPVGTATKEGYTFKGFWTASQPTTGAADYNAYDFANPVDTTTFDTYKAQDGATLSENNLVVTLADGSKYYNAGSQWNPSTGKTVTGDVAYYGWWVSKDITVKFYDVDGTYLGTQTTKYGKAEAASWYPDPQESYNAGAYDYQGFSGKWRDISGVEVGEGTYVFGVDGLDSLTLTPVYTTKTYNDKYLVNFVDPTNGSYIDGNNETNDIASGKYDYRHILEGTNIPEAQLPGTLIYDSGYIYEYIGWTSQMPASGNYHIVSKDDTSVAVNTDWVVRGDITYYAVFRSTVKEYVISFQYTDSTGTVKNDIQYLTYGSAITTPSGVNRTYASGGYGYTLEGWDYVNNDSATVMLAVDGSLIFNEENVFLTAENLVGATPEKPIVFRANYDEGQPTPYTVTFKYKDAKGADKVITAEVYHGYKIEQETVNKISVPAQYDDGEALYTFANKWLVTEGKADKTEYTADEFTSFGPTSHVTFEAVYGEGVPFYTVTYIDGTANYSERILAGSNVPAWMIQTGTDEETGEAVMEEYVPKNYESETGTYKFAGWFDEEQTDKTYAQTNGTEYTTASTVNGDLTLYAQYKFEPFKFIIKFMDYSGKVQLAAAEVEAGQSFEAAFIEAQRAAQHRASDETYTYTFIGWDYKVPDNYICEGKDVTYTAQYRPNYIYYKANWYNSADEMDGDPVITTNYTYGGKVYAPSVELDAPDGMIFNGWYYVKDGVETAYQRGMTITADMDFYAKYIAAPVTYTITTVVGTVETEYKIAENGTAKIIPDPLDGWKDDDYHQAFAGWYTDAACTDGNEFDVEDVVTGNAKIYAKFTTEEHNKNQKEIIDVPTYYAKGSEKVWCACNKEKTIETIEIPMLTDTVAPTGIIYLGTQGKWSSTDAQSGAADTNKYYANDDTDLILTINDTGDVNAAYNPSGVGKGIKMIRAFVSSDDFTAEQQGNASQLAITIFSDDSQTLNNTANYTAKVGDFVIGEVGNTTKLVDGEEYTVYYYAIDKAGNILNKNVRTAKFVYDATAPEFEITGDSNAETATSTVTYCGKATVTEIEVGATVEVNGEEVALTTTSAAGTGSYSITQAGNYIIKVTDRAGNSTSKKIIVADGHDEVTTEQVADCENDGYKKVTCAICGKKISEEKYESAGHQYGATETVAPTCDEGGYDIKICSVCGDEVKTNEVPAAGHSYAKDDNGDIIYTVITAATCKTEGKKIANCSVCGKGTLTETIPVDPDAHVYGGLKTLKATCDADGETYRTCKYCFEKKTEEVLDKLNHVNTGRYTKVTTEPTCYSEGVKTTYCKKCDTVMGTEAIDMIAHTLILVKYEGENNDDEENYPNGYMQYECQATGCTHTEGKTAIAVKATYTVTFKGAGVDGADLVITKTEGESIAATDVADQTKDADNEYTYTFAGWKGTDGKVIKLPITVTKNETYTAEFNSTKRIYTHIFMVPTDAVAAASAEDGYKEFATIVGAYNDTDKKPVAVPTMKGTDTVNYEFVGWSTSLSADDIVDDFTMTDDATFYAIFKEVAIKFNVIFYSGNDAVGTATVDGGKTVSRPENDPEKEADETNHYAFKDWYVSAEAANAAGEEGKFDFANTKIAATTRIYAGYTATAHAFDTIIDKDEEGNVVTWAATCTEAGQTTKKCDCGYVTVIAEPVLGHDWTNGTVTAEDITLDDGTVIKAGSTLCARYDECGAYKAPETKVVNITFNEKIGTETKTLKTYEVEEGKEQTFTAPEKASTAQYEYEFVNWTDAEGNEVAATAELTVTAGTEDAEYFANYTATVRKYYVTYFDADYNIIQSTEVEYGAALPAFTGKEPEKASTASDHYNFAGWSVSADTVVKGQIDITAKFDPEAHEWSESTSSTPPTCTEAGTTNKICKICGDEIPSAAISKPLGHNYRIVDRKDADYGVEGYIKYECQNDNCPEKTKTEVLPALTYKTLTVTVLENGAAVANKKVELYKDGAWFVANMTNKDGKALFNNIKDGSYVILVDGKSKDITVNQDMTVDFELSESSEGSGGNDGAGSCSCSCHRNGFWGMVFRFFHKIIKFFTGEIRCCSNPDSRY